MSDPLVTVIITTYNREIYLETAIKSVILQTYRNIEIIIVDDGSDTNYGQQICNKYPKIKYFYKLNGGVSSARNFGIRKAKGEYIAFLDDDDFWGKSKIEKQIKIFAINPLIDCVHSSAAIVDQNGELTGELIGAAQNKVDKRSGYVFWNALGVWIVKSPTPLIRRKVFQQDLLFDESILAGEDFDFYQRMFYRHKVYYIDEPLAFYRQYPNEKRLSLQNEKYIGIEEKMYSNFKKMGIRNPLVLYKIALKLLKSASQTWNQVYFIRPITINKFDFYLRPVHCLRSYFKI